MRRALMILVLALTLSACGASKSSSSSNGGGGGSPPSTASSQPATSTGTTTDKTHFAKTKFAFHSALAFGAFHRYIYKPYKAGRFQRGSKGRVRAFTKAALAAAFTYHEAKLAVHDARSSRILRPLVAPLNALSSLMTRLRPGLRRDQVSPSEITAANGDIARVSAGSARAGQPITEQAPANPGMIPAG